MHKCSWCDRMVHVACSDAAKPLGATHLGLACPWHRSNMVVKPAAATPISVEPESKDKAAAVGFRPCSHKPCIAKKADNPPELRCQFVNGCSELVHIVCQPKSPSAPPSALTTALCPAHLPVCPALSSSLLVASFRILPFLLQLHSSSGEQAAPVPVKKPVAQFVGGLRVTPKYDGPAMCSYGDDCKVKLDSGIKPGALVNCETGGECFGKLHWQCCPGGKQRGNTLTRFCKPCKSRLIAN